VGALPAATSKPGDTGTQVKKLQRALKALGYSVGAVDGQYGPTTKEAVASFQHDAKLTADGVFGPKTLDALIRRAGP
jgi:peptidoglycan hydrolase-like protein with peptidoglycan-binding domain